MKGSAEGGHDVGMRHLVGSSVVGLLLSIAGLGAAGRSDVADAVMRGDTAAVRALLKTEGGRERHPGRWGDGAALGSVPRGPRHGGSADSGRRECQGGEPRRGHSTRAGEHQRERGHDRETGAGGGGPQRAPVAGGRDGPHDGVAHGQRGGDPSVARPRRGGEREDDAARDHGVDVGGGPGPSGRGPALDRARSGRQRPLKS